MTFLRRAVLVGALAAVVAATGAGPVAAETGGPGELSGRVWFDRDGDNNEDQGEPGRPGAEVDLHQVSPPADYVTYTDENGYYDFTGLALGDYTLHVPDEGYRTSTWNHEDRTIAEPHPSHYDHFGQVGSGIHGLAWDDTNGDGVRQDTEPRRETQITLVGTSDTGEDLERTLTTTGGADFLFQDLPVGTYTLQTVAPPGMAVTQYHAGELWYQDSDFRGTDVLSTDPIRLPWPGYLDTHNDVGFVTS